MCRQCHAAQAAQLPTPPLSAIEVFEFENDYFQAAVQACRCAGGLRVLSGSSADLSDSDPQYSKLLYLSLCPALLQREPQFSASAALPEKPSELRRNVGRRLCAGPNLLGPFVLGI